MASRTAMSPRRTRFPDVNADDDIQFQDVVSQFLAEKDCPFSVTGSIHVPESDPLILFFRTSSGISHSLAFPLKTDVLHQLPALNVLLAACETIPDASSFHEVSLPITERTDPELPLAWPPHLPFATTFELANHPVLDTVRTVLFPHCYPGTYLFAVRDKLEVILAGARAEPRRPSSSQGFEGKVVATVIITLPVRFCGGALNVRSPEGDEDRFYPPTQPQGPSGDTILHWTAFLADCEHEIEFVEQGCRMSISYAVYMKTFGPVGQRPNPLLTPSERLLDALSQVLSISRGRTLGIYLTGRYDCSPADELADSLVPSLKGSDAVLYHALRLYKLVPELRWAAAGYVWPSHTTVKVNAHAEHDNSRSPSRHSTNYPYSVPNSPLHSSRTLRQSVTHPTPSFDDTFSGTGGIGMTGVGAYGRGSRPMIFGPEENNGEDWRDRVVEGGAISLQEADILMLTARDQGRSRKEVPFVSKGTLHMLYVNILCLVSVQ